VFAWHLFWLAKKKRFHVLKSEEFFLSFQKKHYGDLRQTIANTTRANWHGQKW
jgi:hypothetical protein